MRTEMLSINESVFAKEDLADIAFFIQIVQGRTNIRQKDTLFILAIQPFFHLLLNLQLS